MSRVLFTGERLHDDDALFGVDLLRHRAAYAYAIAKAKESGAQRVLDLGCGIGYGAAELGEALPSVFAIDRILPDERARRSPVRFLTADIRGLPIPPRTFDLIVSFQVIEHLEEPSFYLEAIASMLRPGGVAIITTPNLKKSDKENPFHVREYTSDELADLLRPMFSEVEMLGVTASPAPMAYYEARLDRIRKIVRIDPLGLRKVLPRKLIDFLFAKLAVVVRRGIADTDDLSDVTLADFPIEPVRDDCLDLMAVCRAPLAKEDAGA